MKKYEVRFEWKIEDKRDNHPGYRVGVSTIRLYAKNKVDAINSVIDTADHLPGWEFERNNINLEDYREGNSCRVNYRTQLTKILKVEVVE